MDSHDLEVALWRALGDLARAQHQLLWNWTTYDACACGARREMPRTYPHVPSCPTAEAERVSGEHSMIDAGDL